MKRRSAYQVPMVLKTLKILENLADAGGELKLMDIVRTVRVPKASAFRILKTLESTGYVERNSSGSYRLAHKILELSRVVEKYSELRNLGRPILLLLHEEFNETTNLAVLDKDTVFYLLTFESTQPLRVVPVPMGREMVHCTALGKAMAAFLPWETVRSILSRKGMPRRTENTITGISKFKQQLEGIRERGIAYEREEIELGSWCLAAPVLDFTNEAIAAISVSLPMTRVSGREKALEEAIRKAAQQLSRKLGFKEKP